MAKVTLRTQEVRDALVDVLQKALDALRGLPKKKKMMSLTIPEPFDHAVRGHPEGGRVAGCLTSILDDCGEIGILLGVLDAMQKPVKRVPRGRGKRKK